MLLQAVYTISLHPCRPAAGDVEQRLHRLPSNIGQRDRGFAGRTLGAHPPDVPASSAATRTVVHITGVIQWHEAALHDPPGKGMTCRKSRSRVEGAPGKMHRHVLCPKVLILIRANGETVSSSGNPLTHVLAHVADDAVTVRIWCQAICPEKAIAQSNI